MVIYALWLYAGGPRIVPLLMMFLPCVITLYMVVELNPPGEAFVADFTHIRLLACVDAHVIVEGMTLSEGLLAHVTYMRLLSGVEEHV